MIGVVLAKSGVNGAAHRQWSRSNDACSRHVLAVVRVATVADWLRVPVLVAGCIADAARVVCARIARCVAEPARVIHGRIVAGQ